jgi:hypothetical protein
MKRELRRRSAWLVVAKETLENLYAAAVVPKPIERSCRISFLSTAFAKGSGRP